MERVEDWPNKGDLVRVSGCNSAGQCFAPFVGRVSGIEFRCSPPVLFVDEGGYTREIVNIGYGSEWEAVEPC